MFASVGSEPTSSEVELQEHEAALLVLVAAVHRGEMEAIAPSLAHKMDSDSGFRGRVPKGLL